MYRHREDSVSLARSSASSALRIALTALRPLDEGTVRADCEWTELHAAELGLRWKFARLRAADAERAPELSAVFSFGLWAALRGPDTRGSFHPGRSNLAREMGRQQRFASIYKMQRAAVPAHITANLGAIAATLIGGQS